MNGLAGRCFESLGKSITAEPFVRVQFYIRGMLLSGETDASASVRTERFTFPMNMGHIYLSSIVKVTFSDASRSRRNFSFPPQAPIRMLNLLGNTAVRQGNRGMEGLAISPDGRTLFGIMQNALIQDHGLNPGTTDRFGLNNRMLKIDLLTGETHEYVYVLDAINAGKAYVNSCD